MKTPLKESTAANIVLAEIQPDFGPLTTPTKPQEISQGEPWTPTANLKMLISAVSPEIRNRDQKRGLFDNRNRLPEVKDCLHVGWFAEDWVETGGFGELGRGVAVEEATGNIKHYPSQNTGKVWTPSNTALGYLNLSHVYELLPFQILQAVYPDFSPLIFPILQPLKQTIYIYVCVSH